MRVIGWGAVRNLLLLSACPLAVAAGTMPALAQDSSAAAPGTAIANARHHAHQSARKARKASRAASATRIAAAATDPNAMPATAAPARLADIRSGAAISGTAPDSGESVIVTGTRNLGKKARDSTSPIDVISATTLARSGQPNLSDQLTRTDPSISVQAYGADTQALVAAIRLRGLSPNDVLVLIDGKRRHPTSNITADAGPEQGATPVDLNMIPAAAIDHIEILRDGAAAQYGSDAIAGVVNVIMKKTDHGGDPIPPRLPDLAEGGGGPRPTHPPPPARATPPPSPAPTPITAMAGSTSSTATEASPSARTATCISAGRSTMPTIS